MFTEPKILKANFKSKLEFSKPKIWFTESLVYQQLLYHYYKEESSLGEIAKKKCKLEAPAISASVTKTSSSS